MPSLGWSSLEEHIPLRILSNFLPGLLSQNHAVCSLLRHYSRGKFGLNSYPEIMEEMLASQSDTTSGWRKDEWVCGDCVLQFIKRELYGWLARRQLRGQSAYLRKLMSWH